MKRIWRALVSWFEYGDLVPLIVIVSAVHYAVILRSYDWYPVAVAIGLMVDLGHFRTVRAAVRYNGAELRSRLVRWGMAAFMTVVAVAYQQRFYADWFLSLPLPFLIASLAWLQHVDRNVGKRSDPVDAPRVREIGQQKTQPAALPATSTQYVCVCGRTFAKPQSYAAHKRHCVGGNGYSRVGELPEMLDKKE